VFDPPAQGGDQTETRDDDAAHALALQPRIVSSKQ
jgi:hypothetical protein